MNQDKDEWRKQRKKAKWPWLYGTEYYSDNYRQTLYTANVPAKHHRGQPVDKHIKPIPPANDAS
jgi:hypothetical protein